MPLQNLFLTEFSVLIFTAGSRRKKSKASVPAAFSLKSELAQQIKATLKLTDKQIQRCYEVFRLAELDREVCSAHAITFQKLVSVTCGRSM